MTHEELYTVLTEKECTLNSRPLTYQYEIGEALTPSHLILGQRLTPFSSKMSSEGDNLNTNVQVSKRFLFLKEKLLHFWGRWKKEYLVNLRESHRMKSNAPNVVSKGEVVLVHEDGVKRLAWKLGVIEDVIIGKDGEVRGAGIRVMGGGKPVILNRPVKKIYPLEISMFDNVDAVKDTNGNAKERQSGVEKSRTVNDGEKIVREELRRSNPRPVRAAAKDARCKTKLLLDP